MFISFALVIASLLLHFSLILMFFDTLILYPNSPNLTCAFLNRFILSSSYAPDDGAGMPIFDPFFINSGYNILTQPLLYIKYLTAIATRQYIITLINTFVNKLKL